MEVDDVVAAAQRRNGRGETATLPEAAAEAPQHVWPLRSWTTVDLGAESFGETTPPSSVVSELTWGKGAQALGRKGGWGRSYADAPEIDGKVRLLPPDKASKTLKTGEFTRARIVAADGHDLVAMPI